MNNQAGIFLILSAKITFLNPEPSKLLTPTVSISFGTWIVVKEVHPLKVFAPKVFNSVGRCTSCNDVQPSNTPSVASAPKYRRQSGKSTFFKFTHPINAP